MAKYITFISDPELETLAIRSINNLGGELITRGVSVGQLAEYSNDPELILLSNKAVNWPNKAIYIDRDTDLESAIKQPEASKSLNFDKGDGKLILFAGLSGGVGTTSIAINYAFELEGATLLVDANESNPEIAQYLGIHRIENRIERISKDLSITQGGNFSGNYRNYVVDIGKDLNSPLMGAADEIFLICRTSANSFHKVKQNPITNATIVFNFAERSKMHQKWREQISKEFPRGRFANIPLDIQSMELAADSKSALMEVAAKSPVRKSIISLIK